MEKLIKNYRFDIVIHLASQPSAPYATAGIKKASFTQTNNIISTLNIIWTLKSSKKNPLNLFILLQLVSMDSQSLKFPEGFINAMNENKTDTIPYSHLGASWYHIKNQMI